MFRVCGCSRTVVSQIVRVGRILKVAPSFIVIFIKLECLVLMILNKYIINIINKYIFTNDIKIRVTYIKKFEIIFDKFEHI